MTPLRWGITVAMAAFVVDRAVKILVLYGLGFGDLGPGARLEVLPFFDLVMVWNTGISYGLLQAEGLQASILLTVFALVATTALAYWLSRAERAFLGVGLGLVIGGALGNVTDRILYGAVADFFHFHAFGRDWYVFNVADAAITIGVVALLADAFLRPKGPKPKTQE